MLVFREFVLNLSHTQRFDDNFYAKSMNVITVQGHEFSFLFQDLGNSLKVPLC